MPTKDHITVFGATGRIGSALLPLLSTADRTTIAISRHEANRPSLPAIEWATADLGDARSLRPLLERSDRLFVSTNVGPTFVDDLGRLIGMARGSGIAHVVRISSGAADAGSPLFIPQAHGKVDALLAASGVPFTILRCNGMMQNWLGGLAGEVRAGRRFSESTGDGRRAYIDIRDIAEVAFHVLLSPEAHLGRTYFLTGGEALNYTDVAAAISTALAEPVDYDPIGLEEAAQQMTVAGLPPALITTFIAYDRDQRNGRTAAVSPAVRDILGRTPRTIHDFLRDHLAHFR